MAYAHRRIHDADAHIMETPDWLHTHADPGLREKLAPTHVATVRPGEDKLIERFRAQHADPEYRAQDEEQLMLRKNWAATGSFISEDRPGALDLLAQDHSVTVDSPCLYDELLARGQRLARDAGAAYRYIECRVEDLEELDRRLRSRTPLPSQLRGVRSSPPPGTGKDRAGDEVFLAWIRGTKRPETPYLVVDGMQPLARYEERALAYLRG